MQSDIPEAQGKAGLCMNASEVKCIISTTLGECPFSNDAERLGRHRAIS